MGDHTETVDLDFDPDVVSYRELLGMFWKSCDPCTVQHSRQYMTAIFFHDEEQRRQAEETRDEVQQSYIREVSVELLPAQTFYEAEDYHQKYMLRQHLQLLESLDLSDKELIQSPVAAKLNGFLRGFGSPEDFEKECRGWGLQPRWLDYARKYVKGSKF